LNSLYVI